MKKIYFLSLFLLCAFFAQAQTDASGVKFEKFNKANVVKDSTGNVLPLADWYKKISSGDYTIEPLTVEGGVVKDFKIRRTSAEEKKMMAPSPERRGPMTLAGFTTGKPLIDFSVTDIVGKTYTKESFSGKVLVINFWFKDATPCRAEIPELNKLVSKYKGKDVVFLAPTYDPAEDVKEFLKKTPFNYIVCADVDEMIINMKVGKYPTHVVVNKDGIVQFVTIGQTGNIYDMLNEEIQFAL